MNITNLANLVLQYQNLQSAYVVAGQALNNVISTGTVLYNNPDFVTEFPNSSIEYKNYLVQLQSAVNTFIASLPVAPPLNG